MSARESRQEATPRLPRANFLPLRAPADWKAAAALRPLPNAETAPNGENRRQRQKQLAEAKRQRLHPSIENLSLSLSSTSSSTSSSSSSSLSSSSQHARDASCSEKNKKSEKIEKNEEKRRNEKESVAVVGEGGEEEGDIEWRAALRAEAEGSQRPCGADTVALRILKSMRRKDALIARLTRQVESLTGARKDDAEEEEEKKEEEEEQETSKEKKRKESATEMDKKDGLFTGSRGESRPPQRGSPHASSTACELRKKEEELQLLREELAVAQQQWELKEVALEAREREASFFASHVKKLEMQLDDALQERKEDVSALKEHIGHLQRELREKVGEVREKDRQHRSELAALQKDIGELTLQFESQVGTVQEQRKLADDLAAAKRREQDIIWENQQMQRRWLRELEVQKRLVSELREQHQHQEKQQKQQNQQQQQQHVKNANNPSSDASGVMTASSVSAAQQQQQLQLLEKQNAKLRAELSQRRGQLEEQNRVHARAEDEIRHLRLDCQMLADNVSELTLSLQQAQGQRDAALAQVQSLHEAVMHTQSELAQKESEFKQMAEANAQQLEGFLLKEDSRQQTVLSQVEGCVRSTEKLEAALKASEEKRREAEGRLKKAEDEKALAISESRQAQAQAREDMLDQQKLAASVTAFHKEKLQEVHQQLREQAAELSDNQTHSTRVEALLAELQQDHQHLAAEHAQLRTDYERSIQAQRTAGCELVATKEELRKSLFLQLEATQKAQALETQWTQLQATHQRQQQKLRATQEREQVLCRALHELSLLSTSLFSPRGARPARTARRNSEGKNANAEDERDQVEGPFLHASDVSIDAEHVSVSLSEASRSTNTTNATNLISALSTGTSRLSAFGTSLKEVRALRAAVITVAERQAALRRDVAAKKSLIAQLQKEKTSLSEAVERERNDGKERSRALASERVEREKQAQRVLEGAVLEARTLTAMECEANYNKELEARQERAERQARHERSATAAILASELTLFIESLPKYFADCVDRHSTSRDVASADSTNCSANSSEEDQEAGGLIEGGALLVDVEAPRQEIQAECDAIARELLGFAGGYSDFSAIAQHPDGGDQRAGKHAAYFPEGQTSKREGKGGEEGAPTKANREGQAPISIANNRASFSEKSSPRHQDRRRPPPLPLVVWSAQQLDELRGVLTEYLCVALNDKESDKRAHEPTVKRKKATVSFQSQEGTIAEKESLQLPLATRRADSSTGEAGAQGSLASTLREWERSQLTFQQEQLPHATHEPGAMQTPSPSSKTTVTRDASGGGEAGQCQRPLLTELLKACALRSMPPSDNGQ